MGGQCLTCTQLLPVLGTRNWLAKQHCVGFQRLENLNLVPPPLQGLKVSGQIRSVWLLNYVRQSVPVLVLEVYLDVIQCFCYFRPSTGLIALGLGSSSCRLLSEPFLVSESLLLSSPDFLVSRSALRAWSTFLHSLRLHDYIRHTITPWLDLEVQFTKAHL